MKEESILVSIRYRAGILKEVERVAEKRKMSRSDVIRMCLELGVECHKDMESLGLIGVVDLIHYVRQSIKKSARGQQLPLPL